jgi:putative SOS response-associated peptidase YedK
VCGRYQRRSDKQRIAEAFALGNVDGLTLELTPDYNVAPQTMQPVIVWDEDFGTRTLHMMFWRFLPRFVTDPKKFKLSTINAKGETLPSNQMWQDSFLKRRCLVPVDTFLEWRKDGKRRLPYVFAMKDDQPFALGGVWRHWRSPDRKNDMDTFAIITVELNELVSETTGHDRMPLIVARKDWQRWLELGNPEQPPRMFNISEIAGQGPDAEGNVIPATVQEGSATLVGSQADNQHILAAMDSGVYNVRKATCYGPCLSCDGATSWWVALNPFGLGVGDQTQENLVAQWDTGSQYTYNDGSWSTGNNSVATVQAGLVHGVSHGSISLVAYADEPEYITCQLSCPILGYGSGSSPGNVVQVSIPIADITSNKIQVVLTGPTGVTGQLSLTVTGPNGAQPVQPISTGSNPQGPGTYNYDFGLSSIPVGEYTTVKATWTVDGTGITGQATDHFKVMGVYRQTVYNSPAEKIAREDHKL